MVVDGYRLRILEACDLDRSAVGHVMDDVDVQSAHRVDELGLLLAVGEAGVLHVDREVRAVEGAGQLASGYLLAVQIIDERDLLQQLGLCHLVSLGECLGDLLIAVYVKSSQVLDDLACEILAARAGNNPQLVRFDDAHVKNVIRLR